MKVAGYEIIQKEVYDKDQEGAILLGKHPGKEFCKWATWDSNKTGGAFWGHYFDNEADARKDFHERLAYQYIRPF